MANVFNVSTEADLNAALQQIDLSPAQNTNYTINFENSITLTSQLDAINLIGGDTLTIDGQSHALDGGGANNGLLVYAGNVAIENLSINNAAATGGAGGGGGAGLGGGLFVGSAGDVTLSDVTFTGDSATGGAGDAFFAETGGGGLDGGAGSTGGGGVGFSASGGNLFSGSGAGIILGAPSGGAGGDGGAAPGASGGGGGNGGGGETSSGGGGGVGGDTGEDAQGFNGGIGGAGGFGGGGGVGGNFAPIAGAPGAGGAGGDGGFGGGGGDGGAGSGISVSGVGGAGGAGGFGGGGGGGEGGAAGGAGGFGGGDGGISGGGGLGAGGAIFVQEGGVLNFLSGAVSGGSVAGGASTDLGGDGGAALGSGLFLQGNQQILLDPGAGQTLTISDVIADQTGSGGAGANAGAGSLLLDGVGTVELSAANTFSGGVSFFSDTLDLANAHAAGSGTIDFISGGLGTLKIETGDAPTNVISGFVFGETIDLAGVTATSASVNPTTDVLTVSNGGVTVATLQLDASAAREVFTTSSDGTGGTDISPAIIVPIITDFNVGSETDLNNAIAQAALTPTPNTAYTFNFENNITLDDQLASFNLASGDTVTISGVGDAVLQAGDQIPLNTGAGQTLTVDTVIAGSGALSLDGVGTVKLSTANTFGGGVTLSSGTLDLANAKAAGSGAIAFESSGGPATLRIESGDAPTNVISGFVFGETIDLAGVTATSASVNPTTDVLTVSNGGVTVATLQLDASATREVFTTSSDGTGGTDISPASIVPIITDFNVGSETDLNDAIAQAALTPTPDTTYTITVGGDVTVDEPLVPFNVAPGDTFVITGGQFETKPANIGGLGTVQLQFDVETGQFADVDTKITDASGGGPGEDTLVTTGSPVETNSTNTFRSDVILPSGARGLANAQAAASAPGGPTADGLGTVEFFGDNTYSGGTLVDSGTFELANVHAAGTGAITFASGATATLKIDSGDVPANIISGFVPGDIIDLADVVATSAKLNPTNDVLTISNAGVTVATLQLDASAVQESFATSSDGAGGTDIEAVPLEPITLTGTANAIVTSDEVAVRPFSAVVINDPNAGQTETAVVTLSNPANGALSDPHAATDGGVFKNGVYTVSGSASAVAAALDGLVFTPKAHEVAPGSSVTTTITATVIDTGQQSGSIAANVTANALNTITLGNGIASIKGSATGSQITFGSGAHIVTLHDNGNVVKGGDGLDLVSGGGSYNVIALGAGADGVSLSGGDNTVTLGNGLDVVTLGGGGNTVTLGNGLDAVTVGGSGNQISLGSGVDVVHGGTGDTISLNKTALTLYGTNETVLLGAGSASVADLSTGIDVKIGPTAGADILSHFGSDPGGVVELLGGIGHFGSTAGVLSALKSDGHGGTLLSFGSQGSLDFAGVASSQLHASNFEIG
jgi:hypothetical protein